MHVMTTSSSESYVECTLQLTKKKKKIKQWKCYHHKTLRPSFEESVLSLVLADISLLYVSVLAFTISTRKLPIDSAHKRQWTNSPM